MFKRTQNEQLDLFNNVYGQLSKRSSKLLSDPQAFHHIFFRELISRIDESVFSVLYTKNKGRPNASIRVILGMMILKEGNGWSDEQLFEACRFDMRIRLSLGYTNLREDIPVESSYYLFRSQLQGYQKSEGVDLLAEAFRGVTQKQMAAHGVSGSCIRMDSKLLNSNIARCSRLELIMGCLHETIKDAKIERYKELLTAEQYDLLERIHQNKASKLNYQMNSDQKKQALNALGFIIKTILGKWDRQAESGESLLARLYKEQYEQEEAPAPKGDLPVNNEDNGGGSIKPKSSKDIRSDSLQSPYDTEASYRKKGNASTQQEVAGYHQNIVESCDESSGLNLILDVQTEAANVSEDKFLIPAIERTETLIEQLDTDKIETVITDGGYDSVTNRSQMLKENNPDWKLAKTKGRKGVYKMQYDQQDQLQVSRIDTAQQCEVKYSQKAEKWVVIHADGTKRYFTQEQIDQYMDYQRIADKDFDKKYYNLRANVESTIHQVYHRLKKRNKTVYRGQYKSHIYALSRAFWVNCVRICAKNTQIGIEIQIMCFKHFIALQKTKITETLHRICQHLWFWNIKKRRLARV